MNKQTLPIYILSTLLVLIAFSLLFNAHNKRGNLGGTTAALPPEFSSLASSTVFLVPNDENIAIGQSGDLLFGTSSRRVFLSIWATSTTGIFVTLGDIPCNGAFNARYFLSASTTATSRAELEFNADKPYVGAVHLCGVGGTTSVAAIQAVSN